MNPSGGVSCTSTGSRDRPCACSADWLKRMWRMGYGLQIGSHGSTTGRLPYLITVHPLEIPSEAVKERIMGCVVLKDLDLILMDHFMQESGVQQGPVLLVHPVRDYNLYFPSAVHALCTALLKVPDLPVVLVSSLEQDAHWLLQLPPEMFLIEVLVHVVQVLNALTHMRHCTPHYVRGLGPPNGGCGSLGASGCQLSCPVGLGQCP